MTEWNQQGGNLVFILSPPRAGSTMLQLMLESHSAVAGGPEPHVIVPLRFTGYFAHPEKADYNILNAALGIKEFVSRLPGGEDDYIDACRAYAGHLYGCALRSKPGARLFVDKTPPNTLEWPFLTRLFPAARYLVLVRHPAAVLHSFAGMSFMGDYALAHAERPVLHQYIPAIAAFLRDGEATKTVVRYEDLVQRPEQEVARLLEFLDLPYEQAVVDYGSTKHATGGVGDQIQAYRLKRPDASSIDRWKADVAASAARRACLQSILEGINPEDMAAYGYPLGEVVGELAAVAGGNAGAPRRHFRFHHVKRRIYFALRSLTRRTVLGKALRRLRYYLDVLLRD